MARVTIGKLLDIAYANQDSTHADI